jgi:hypothetical protein
MGTLLREHLAGLVRDKKISPNEMSRLMQHVSDPWEQARGLLKHRKMGAVAYQKKRRGEWNR